MGMICGGVTASPALFIATGSCCAVGVYHTNSSAVGCCRKGVCDLNAHRPQVFLQVTDKTWSPGWYVCWEVESFGNVFLSSSFWTNIFSCL